jgi:E3 ubiquitin-protein ligase TRIP12
MNESLAGLSLVHHALNKLPEIKTPFVREGVVFELTRLQSGASSVPDGEQREGLASANPGDAVVNSVSSAQPEGSGVVGPISTVDTLESTRSVSAGNSSRLPPTAPGSLNAFASSITGGLSAATVSGLAPLLQQADVANERNASNLGAAGPVGIFHGIGSSRLPLRVSSLRRSSSTPDVTAAILADVAKSIVEQHLGPSSEMSQGCDPILDELTAVGRSMKSALSSSSIELIDPPLNSMAQLLADSAGLSTFELSRSGVVDALAALFSAEGHSEIVRTQRTVAFVRAMNSCQAKDPFGLLVARVLGVFASEEKLPLCVSDSAGSQSSVSVGIGLRQLAQPFKLCLKRNPSSSGGDDLRDYSHHVVLIEPLATMHSVQDFLWNRVQPQGTSDIDLTGNSNSLRRNGGRNDGSDADLHLEVDEMVLGEVEAAIDADDDDDGDEDADDDHPLPDLRDDDEDGSEDDPEHSGAEEGMFELDEEGAVDGGELHDGDEDGIHSDEDFSSGSEDVISGEHGTDDQNQDMDGPPSFGVDQLGTSLPPVELDHDTLAQSLGHSPFSASGSAAGGSGSTASGRASNRSRSGLNSRVDSFAGSVVPLRSYAAALASGMQRNRVGGRSSFDGTEIPGQPRRLGSLSSAIPKLVFSLNGREIPKESSILHAVLHSRGDGMLVGPRLWNEVYTLTYSKATASADSTRSDPDESIVGGSSVLGAVSGGSGSRPTRRSRRLSGRSAPSSPAFDTVNTPVRRRSSSTARTKHLLERSCDLKPADVLDRPEAFVPGLVVSDGLPEAVRNTVYLLKHLNWIYKSMRRGGVALGSEANTVCLEHSSDLGFVSEKVTAKLQRQLSDLLALCGGAIPKWCHTLARDASFLFPFEARLVLFQSTALGVARALHLLQLRADVSSVGADASRHGSHHRSQAIRDTEARISRIQRQKVRIHRSRVLESAIRVMSMYATHGTVLEVEYFDEVGTGLGPTLEFYTLVSRELQRVDLGLWRSKHLVPSSNGRHESVVESRKTDKDLKGVELRNVDVAEVQVASSSSTRRSSIRTRRRDRESAVRADACITRRPEVASESPIQYVVPTGDGLMPTCIPCVDTGNIEYAERLSYFPFMGRLVAKALSDGRLLDLRWSHVFCKLLLACCNVILKNEKLNSSPIDGKDTGSSSETSCAMLNYLAKVSDADLWREFSDGSPGLCMLHEVDPELAASLQSILDMLNSSSKSAIADLCLTFVLPGNDSIELVANGKVTEVSGENAFEYVAAVVRYVLCSGVRRQAEAFLRGFGDVLDLKSLLLFRADELELLMCGPAFEMWSVDFLVQATRCDHGYRHESAAVESLLQVLSELGPEDQRRFVLFATGSPALPVGGLLGLNPRLTIVKRTPEGGRSADECLPTVMTCTNYFKLPDYSSFDITKSRLLYALREGQGSFHLS